VPKKAVALFFFFAFVGAVIFVYFTFPRTKEEIPTSNNQRPFPSAPPEPTPNSVPVPETVPHPNTPKLPPGPNLRVMAWGSEAEAKVLEAEADAFGAATGRHVSLTIDTDLKHYQPDVQQAIASATPPDVCLVSARDFCGLDPARDLADVGAPIPDIVARSMAAFMIGGEMKAMPDEFSVDVLFYNPSVFDRAGLGYPGPHWTWDMLEAMSRGLASLKLKDTAGQPIYPLELPADFDLWNILCAEAGHPALDLDVWHLADTDTKDSQMRALDSIHNIFQEFAVTAPPTKGNEPAGRLFAQQRAALLIAPSDLTATLPNFPYAFTVLPSDMTRASLARVNGWAVTARSPDAIAAFALVRYFAYQPVHAGWSSALRPAHDDSPQSVCYDALDHALIPRIEANTAPLVQFLDQQIYLLASDGQQKTDTLYATIQNEYVSETSPPSIQGGLPHAAGQKPIPKTESSVQLRGL
jgi:ABC-type glycerol-3-phosphate transport system substrate-binding protein